MNWIPELAQQCCDAFEYQQMGMQCAVNGLCYDPLRPVGAVLWFSLPDRLQAPFEILNILHLLLCLLSVTLSTHALCQFLTPCSAPGRWRHVHIGVLLGFSALVHTIYFLPVLFVSLTDAPAGLFLLCGIWLLLLWQKKRATHMLLSAGLCLGMAAWLRVFYLYPLVLMLLTYVFFWCRQATRQWRELGILTACLPLLLQLFATWQHYGYISYLERTTENDTIGFHMNRPVIGYDTALPSYSYSWQPRWCTLQVPPELNPEFVTYRNVLCVMPERLQFYFGSYSARTYTPSDSNLLLDNEWKLTAFDVAPANSPLATSQEPAMYAKNTAPTEGAATASQVVSLASHSPYTLSVWLWSTQPQTVILSLLHKNDPATLASSTVTTTTEPTRYTLTAITGDTTSYIAQFIIPSTAQNMQNAGVNFWQGQLEQGSVARDFRHSIEPPADTVRTWSFTLLLANGCAMVAALVLLWRVRGGLCVVHRASIVLLLMILAEGLIFVPEQRFMITFNTALWLLCSLAVMLTINRVTTAHTVPVSAHGSTA